MNTSSGYLGRILAEEGLRRGYDIHHFHGPFSQLPQSDGSMSGTLQLEKISWLEELLPSLRSAGEHIHPVVVFHAMAVLDYVPEMSAKGKQPSGTSWTLDLKPTPKVIDLIPDIFPGSKLIGFKLETRISREKLIERASELARRTNAELVVANLLEWVDGDSYECILVDRDNTIIESIRGRMQLAEFLWDVIETTRSGVDENR